MSSTILETQLYPVHCTECGEKIDNRFFPLNRFLKQYFLGVAYSKKISNLVDFLGIGAMYGETVLPDVPDFYKDGKWLLDKPEISADKRPPEFSCGDNEVTADRLVQAQLNIAAMVAQFGLTTGFWEIYPMLKLRKELDDLAVAFGEPSSEQTAQWKTFCDKLARIPGVKADTLLTQDKRNAMIAGYLSDILTLAREEAKMAGKSHFASQEILIGWRYKVENNRKLPYAFVARGELTGSFDTRECCCDKCRRPIPWDLGAYRQKVVGILGTQAVGKTTYLMALTDAVKELKFRELTITHDASDPQWKRVEQENGMLWVCGASGRNPVDAFAEGAGRYPAPIGGGAGNGGFQRILKGDLSAAALRSEKKQRMFDWRYRGYAGYFQGIHHHTDGWGCRFDGGNARLDDDGL